jgi:hypothetical protein
MLNEELTLMVHRRFHCAVPVPAFKRLSRLNKFA